jgi:soluble lytic murein transglycosylase
VRRLCALYLATTFAATGCERSTAQARPVASGPVRPAALVATAPAEDKPARPSPSAQGPWVEALRAGRYADAARELDALGDLSQKPELRFARARAAAELGEPERVIELLAGLETKLPALAPRIQRLRADAQLVVGPHAAAADFFTARGDVESLARAAQARERAGELAKASALATQVVSELKGKRRRSVEALARDVRARAAERNGAKAQAVADLRWLSLEDPVGNPDAAQRLERLAPERALSKEERLARAIALGRAGAIDRVEAELTALARAPGPAIASARLDRARALALYYGRSNYRKASELFARAGRGPGTDPAEAAFFAARALSRAQDDEQAVRGYRDVSARFPRSSFAEQASYLLARVHYAGGRFAEAAAAYDAYLGRFGARGRSRAEALYERSVSWLALGRNGQAALAFASLARTEKDSRRAARLRHLEGVARAAAGETARAEQLFRQVVRDQPLGFQALASAARLAELAAAAQPFLLPGPGVPVQPTLNALLPDGVRALHALGLDRDAELALIPSESTFSAQFGARGGEALCDAYGLLGVAARRYQVAQDHVEVGLLRLGLEPGTRWQWNCFYPAPYPSGVRAVAQTANVPVSLLYGVMRQESAFRPEAASGAGARGLMQLLPTTAERVAREFNEPFDPTRLTDPHTNLRLGARYLQKLLGVFDGNVPLAAAAYNAGPVAVQRWLANANQLPLDVFVARIPYGETLEYVERVIGNFARYQYLEGGEPGVPKLALALPKAPPASGDLY